MNSIGAGKNVTITVAGASVNLLYAGAQGQFPGLDQMNASLPVSAVPSGLANVVLSVDGVVSNALTVTIP